MRTLGMVHDREEQMQTMVKSFIELDISTYISVACAAEKHEIESWLGAVDVPVFVTVGTKDWLTPAANIETVFDTLPNATLQVFEGTHFPILEEPARIAETLSRVAQLSH